MASDWKILDSSEKFRDIMGYSFGQLLIAIIFILRRPLNLNCYVCLKIYYLLMLTL